MNWSKIDKPGIIAFLKAPTLCSALVLPLFTGCGPSLQTTPWESLNGPVAQNISTVLINANDASTLYAGLLTGELFRSTDRGKSWSRASTITLNAPIHQLAQHPDERSTLFAATGEGLFVSSNGGVEWTKLTVVSTHESCRSIAVDPWNPSHMYAGIDHRGMHKTTNSGNTWSPCNTGLPADKLAEGEFGDIIVHPALPDIVYATVSGIGVIRSTDAGYSWEMLTGRLTAGRTFIRHVIVHPSRRDVLCIGTGAGDIYRSTNGGTTWSLTHQGLSYSEVRSFSSDPVDPALIYAGTESGVLVSEDFGESWNALGPGLAHISTAVVASPDSAGSVLYIYGEGIGFQRSPDAGSSWERIDNRLGGSSISRVLTSRSGNVTYAVSGRALYRYQSDRGWTQASDGLPGTTITDLAVDGSSDTLLYASTMTGIFSTTDGGGSWKPLGTAIQGIPAQFIGAHPSIANRLLSVNANGMMVSTDKGVSWKHVKPLIREHEIEGMSFHHANAGIIAAATSNKAVLASRDGGLTWDEGRYGITSDQVLAVTFSPADQKTYYAWTSDGDAFRSTNNSIEWSRHTHPWKTGNDVRIARDHFNPWSVVALVDRKQIYYSDSGGENWTELAPAELSANPLTLHWNHLAAMLYIGTGTEGVFRLSLGRAIEKARR